MVTQIYLAWISSQRKQSHLLWSFNLVPSTTNHIKTTLVRRKYEYYVIIFLIKCICTYIAKYMCNTCNAYNLNTDAHILMIDLCACTYTITVLHTNCSLQQVTWGKTFTKLRDSPQNSHLISVGINILGVKFDEFVFHDPSRPAPESIQCAPFGTVLQVI